LHRLLSRVTAKPEVIRVRRPIVRNRDSLSPLACVVGLPYKCFRADSTSPVSALTRSWRSPTRASSNPAVEQPANEVIPRTNQHGHHEHEGPNLINANRSETAHSEPTNDKCGECSQHQELFYKTRVNPDALEVPRRTILFAVLAGGRAPVAFVRRVGIQPDC